MYRNVHFSWSGALKNNGFYFPPTGTDAPEHSGVGLFFHIHDVKERGRSIEQRKNIIFFAADVKGEKLGVVWKEATPLMPRGPERIGIVGISAGVDVIFFEAVQDW